MIPFISQKRQRHDVNETTPKRWVTNPMVFFTHWLCTWWEHRIKATVPMMRHAGLPISQKLDKTCNRECCQDKVSHFQQYIDQMKNKFS